MREYINKLSIGKFRYEVPSIIEPKDTINNDVLAGTYEENKFKLHIQASGVIKGLVYSSDSRIIIKNRGFSGIEADIEYIVDARGLNEKDKIEGEFTIVSDSGEKKVPFVVMILQETLNTSLGKAENLFHFTNLVQKYPKEAAAIYESDDFKRIFLKNDTSLINLYEGLLDKENVYESMEEFLIAIRKKPPVTFGIEAASRSYVLDGQDCKDNIYLEKSGWGYIELDISCDADFVILSKEKLTSKDFEEDAYSLEYTIDYEKLHNGVNYARINIGSRDDKRIIMLAARKKVKVSLNEEQALYKEERRIQKRARIELTNLYLAFRMKHLSQDEWVAKTNEVFEQIQKLKKPDMTFEVLNAGIHFISGNDEAGNNIIERIKDSVLSNVENHVELYCLYLYISTLQKKDSLYTSNVSEIVTKYYENGYDSWKILWILFYIDAQIENNKSIKLIRIKDTFNDGCISPVMYLEALNIYNKQPDLLRVLNRFEVQVISEGIKYSIVSRKLAKQVAEVIGNEKNCGLENIELLKKLYEDYKDDTILEVLIVHLIRAGITDESVFFYYEKAVQHGIRITRLYEFYMASIKKDINKKISKIVLLYFAYDSGDNYTWKSYLYANVLHNKEMYKDIYNSYEHTIEQYIYEQLKNENIDNYLMYLYHELLTPKFIKNETAAFVAKLRFMYRITLHNDDVKAIAVKYGEFLEPDIYYVKSKDVFIPLYTKDCAMYFICSDGVHRKDTVNFTRQKVFDISNDITEFEQYNINDKYLNMYNAEYYRRKHIYNKKTLDIYKKAITTEGISEVYKMQLNSWMIEFYEDYYSKKTFNEEYKQLITENLDITTASKLIELLLDYGMYYEARSLIEKYGFIYVSKDRLFKFMVHELDASMNTEEYKNIITEYVYKNHLYNEIILSYMVNNYNGTNEDMYSVWKSSTDFGIDTLEISERLVSQLMFTGELSERLKNVFNSYYKNGASEMIVKAYASYNAFMYLIKKRQEADVAVEAIKRAYMQKTQFPLICYTAMLKKLSEELELLKKSDIKEVAQKLLKEMCEKELIYEFYKKFKGVLDIPYNANGVTILEYIAPPDKKVMLNYRLNDEKAYKSTAMKCDECGIFTYKMSIFYDDKVNFYYTVSGQDSENIEEHSFICDDVNEDVSLDRFDAINDCLVSLKLKDVNTLKQLMTDYVAEDYVTKELFVPIKMR